MLVVDIVIWANRRLFFLHFSCPQIKHVIPQRVPIACDETNGWGLQSMLNLDLTYYWFGPIFNDGWHVQVDRHPRVDRNVCVLTRLDKETQINLYKCDESVGNTCKDNWLIYLAVAKLTRNLIASEDSIPTDIA